MANSWTELWSFGLGRSQVRCGVARTEEGFTVEVWRSDCCIESEQYPTREMAVRAALACERRYHPDRIRLQLKGEQR
jgi:hypothetical protein